MTTIQNTAVSTSFNASANKWQSKNDRAAILEMYERRRARRTAGPKENIKYTPTLVDKGRNCINAWSGKPYDIKSGTNEQSALYKVRNLSLGAPSSTTEYLFYSSRDEFLRHWLSDEEHDSDHDSRAEYDNNDYYYHVQFA